MPKKREVVGNDFPDKVEKFTIKIVNPGDDDPQNEILKKATGAEESASELKKV